jgi:hypothetical protein
MMNYVHGQNFVYSSLNFDIIIHNHIKGKLKYNIYKT